MAAPALQPLGDSRCHAGGEVLASVVALQHPNILVSAEVLHRAHVAVGGVQRRVIKGGRPQYP
jgi:hypothetical protein